MERHKDSKVVTVLEHLSGHKILIKGFKDKTNLCNKLSVEELLDGTIFDFLIDAREDSCAPYDVNTFISLDICKKVTVTKDATCGYASIAKAIGKNPVYIVEQLSEQYLTEFEESSNLFIKGKNLSDWIKKNQFEPLPEDLSLNLDDVHAISDKLMTPILIFQPCDNFAGYTCIAFASPIYEEDEEFTGTKIICLLQDANFYEMLAVVDSKEIEFHHRLSEILHHFTQSKIKSIVDSGERPFIDADDAVDNEGDNDYDVRESGNGGGSRGINDGNNDSGEKKGNEGVADGNSIEQDDDEAVTKIVEHGNDKDKSSTTVPVYTFDTLPKEYHEGLYDENLSPSLKHYYGTKPAVKKVFFNVYKCKKKQNIILIKIYDYAIFKKCQKAKERFIFAGILCGHADYYKYHSSENKKLMSKYLVFDTVNSAIVRINKSELFEGQGNARKYPSVIRTFNASLQRLLKSSGSAAGFSYLLDISVNQVSEALLPAADPPSKEPPEKEPPPKAGDKKTTKEDKKKTASCMSTTRSSKYPSPPQSPRGESIEEDNKEIFSTPDRSSSNFTGKSMLKVAETSKKMSRNAEKISRESLDQNECAMLSNANLDKLIDKRVESGITNFFKNYSSVPQQHGHPDVHEKEQEQKTVQNIQSQLPSQSSHLCIPTPITSSYQALPIFSYNLPLPPHQQLLTPHLPLPPHQQLLSPHQQLLTPNLPLPPHQQLLTPHLPLPPHQQLLTPHQPNFLSQYQPLIHQSPNTYQTPYYQVPYQQASTSSYDPQQQAIYHTPTQTPPPPPPPFGFIWTPSPVPYQVQHSHPNLQVSPMSGYQPPQHQNMLQPPQPPFK